MRFNWFTSLPLIHSQKENDFPGKKLMWSCKTLSRAQPGIGVHINHTFTGNQNQAVQRLKRLKSYSGGWNYSWHSHQSQFTSQHLDFILKPAINSAQEQAAQSIVLSFLLFLLLVCWVGFVCFYFSSSEQPHLCLKEDSAFLPGVSLFTLLLKLFTCKM